MPNRYEREIEEILRNLEDPKAGPGQKIGRRPKPQVRTQSRPTFSLRFSATEWLLTITVVAALLGGGYAYAQRMTPDLFTGIVAVVGTISFILVAFSQFIFQQRRPPSARYVKITPLRRGPMDFLRTRWHLFMLKIRYRRRNDLR